ncbi:alpha/beta fold hydrolase [Brevundimonas sp.]|uniref:alpha/beta fold hydrolase n=1 Tax=Brevundimonas sp. TaxID=1871086 RepID=UPI003BACC1AB
MMRRLFLLMLLFAPLAALPAQAREQAASAFAPIPAFQSDRIVVTAQGSGPDVILIPGLASTAEVWRRTADRLDDRYRVHLVSIRGFGDIPVGANGQGAVLAPVAAEVRRYITSQRLDRPAIVGHSMGGLIALRVAAGGGASVGRVMAVDASPFFPSLISPGATVGDIEPIARIGYQALMFLGDEVLRTQGTAMGFQLGGASDSLFGAMGWQGGDRATLAQSLYEVMTTDLRSRLPDVRAPVTVVYGWSRDDASPRAHIDGLFRAGYRSLRTPARFEPVEGAEHMVMIDQPARFMEVLNRFLAP